MNATHLPLAMWLGQSLLAGGVLLLAARVVTLMVREPHRRMAFLEWSLRAALVIPVFALLPSWWRLPRPDSVPLRVTSAQFPRHAYEEKPDDMLAAPGNASAWHSEWTPGPTDLPRTTAPVRDATEIATTADAGVKRGEISGLRWSQLPLPEIGYGVYVAGAVCMFLRWLAGHVALWRLLSRSRTAVGRPMRHLLDLTKDWSAPPRLRVARGIQVPVCFGLLRPTILLPQSVAEHAHDVSLRCVLAHELAHLWHGDAWVCWWTGFLRAVYWPLPWFWGLERQLRLCQEFRADAAAAVQAGRAVDYAAFLVDLSRSLAGGTRRFAVATAVLGSSSDLYRRINMLLKSGFESGRRSRPWAFVAAGSFLALAVLLAGFGWSRTSFARPADEPTKEKKDEAKKDAPKADDNSKPATKPLRPRGQFGGDNLPEEYRQMMQKMMEEMLKKFQQPGANFPNVPDFGGALVVPGFPGQAFRTSGRLGVAVEKPSAALIEHLDLPKDQGLVIGEVTADSPAAKAGLKANDILLEIGGKAVANDVGQFRKQLAEIKTDSAVDAMILRKGKRETIKGIKLPEAKAEAAFPAFPEFDFRGPNIKLLPLPPMPVPAVPPELGGAEVNQMSVQITNGQFSIHSHKDGLTIDITGSLDADEAKVSSVGVRDGEDSYKTSSIDKLPEKYRDKAKELLKNVQVTKKK